MPWFIIAVVINVIYFLLDLLVRRKSWKKNSRDEKSSIAIAMACNLVFPFVSVFGILSGLVYGGSGAFFDVIHSIYSFLGSFIWLVALAAMVLSLIFRKKEKLKASRLVYLIACAYIAVFIIVMLIGSI